MVDEGERVGQVIELDDEPDTRPRLAARIEPAKTVDVTPADAGDSSNVTAETPPAVREIDAARQTAGYRRSSARARRSR